MPLTIQEMLQQEQEVQKNIHELIEDLKKTIEEEFKEEDGSMRFVRFSEIKASKTMILDPVYYLWKPQAQALIDKLRPVQSVSGLCKTLQEILDNRSVTINKTKTMLNDKMIAAITHSAIGRYLQKPH